jgi:hypothetical protein
MLLSKYLPGAGTFYCFVHGLVPYEKSNDIQINKYKFKNKCDVDTK